LSFGSFKSTEKVADFEVTKWGRDVNGKSFPVEWKHKSGAEVNIDLGHFKNGPQVPHVGYQTGGKTSTGDRQRGHILLDDVPFNR
jgi:toxin YxiD